jgi:hypothetical protein
MAPIFEVKQTSMIRRFTLSLGILAALLLIACASAPVQEMSDARQAIQAAKAAGADVNVDQNLSKAETYLQDAQSAIEVGEYSVARDSARAAREEALQAQKNQASATTTN